MAHVEVILSEDIPRLGDAGELVKVRPGFARNYLLPQGKAILATESSKKALSHHQRVIAEKVARERKTIEAEKARLEALTLEIAVQVGEEGKLFGSVTAAQIAELLEQKGVSIDRRKLELPEPIKEAGEHTVPLRLHREVIARLRLTVTAAE